MQPSTTTRSAPDLGVPRPWSLASSFAAGDRRFAPAKLAVLMDLLEEAGAPSEAVLAGTGLDAAAVRDPFTLTSPLQFLTAARNAVRLYPGDDLGVRVGLRLHATCYGMYGYALLCSGSLEQAFDTAVQYHQLANGMLQIRWIEMDGMASWVFAGRDAVPLSDLDGRLYRFLLDLQFAVHVTVIKDVMGPWCRPARATFAEPEPPHAAALAQALECPVAFGQPQNLLCYPMQWLPRAPQLANSTTAAHVSTQCARLLDEFKWQSGVTRRVYQELTLTPGRFPEIDTISENLCMTSRTLRRKLAAEGTSYSELLASIRKALAIDYLATTSLSTEDIAILLGFGDAVGFRHAFKRWTGKPPSAYRRS